MRFICWFSMVLSVTSLFLLMGTRFLPHLPHASSIFACPRCLPFPSSAFLPPQSLIQKVVPSYRNFSTSQLRAMAADDQGKNIVVYVTVPNKDAGKDLAHSIVNAKLAACVNQVPGIESTYWWEGKVETDSEVLLIIKTRESLLKDLTEHVIKNHKYEVPEVIALPIIGGNPAYLKWLEDSTKVE